MSVPNLRFPYQAFQILNIGFFKPHLLYWFICTFALKSNLSWLDYNKTKYYGTFL